MQKRHFLMEQLVRLLLSLCETIAELEQAPRWLQWLVMFIVHFFKWCLPCGDVYPKPDLAEDIEAAWVLHVTLDGLYNGFVTLCSDLEQRKKALWMLCGVTQDLPFLWEITWTRFDNIRPCGLITFLGLLSHHAGAFSVHPGSLFYPELVDLKWGSSLVYVMEDRSR